MFTLTELRRFRGVEGEFQVGLRPLGQPRLFLFHTELIGLQSLELETCILPQSSEAGEQLSQQLLSVHANADLEMQQRHRRWLSSHMKWNGFRYVSRMMSHHSLRSKATGSADAEALHAGIAESLTHCFYICLRHLENQTQLLAEQQLHDCVDKDAWFCINY